MNFVELSKEYKQLFEELPLKDFGVFIYHHDGFNNVERHYFETKEDAVNYAKSLELDKGYCVKVWQRTENPNNKGFNKLIWRNKKVNEDLVKDGLTIAASFNPLTALAVKHRSEINNTIKGAVNTAEHVAKFTSDAWKKLKRKLEK